MWNFKSLFVAFICSVTTSMYAQVQEVSSPLRSSPVNQGIVETTDTLSTPFVDDFSYPLDRPNPSLWSDAKVWVNDAMPQFPQSIGVATFDGLDENGFAYAENSLSSDTFADVLTSAYLDLSGSNDVYLSFELQEGGRGELPSSTDSIVVEFWSPLDSSWSQVWGQKGTQTSGPFRSIIIPVTGQNYIQRGFRFRFGAYGARAGAYDIWNIDYVQLDEDRNPADTVITEPAFARPHPLIIGAGPYTSWPWWVSSASNASNRPTDLDFTYRRNGTVPSGGWSLNLGQFRWEENGTLIQQTTAVPVITNTQHDQDQVFTINVPAAALTNLSGPTTVETKVWFDGSAAGFQSNDTVRGRLELDNYLALDDGKAERAYAVQNVLGGRVAQKFRTSGLSSTDSLKGVRFQFVDAGASYPSTFRLAVWAPADSGDYPGALLYMSDSLYRPHTGYYRGDWMPYDLDSAVDIEGYTHLWIGYICTTSDPMYVGLDVSRNLPASMPRYYGDGFNWYQSLEAGVVMMEPYFRYSPANMDVVALEANEIGFYPNPSSGRLYLRSEQYTNVAIYSLSGKKVFEEAFHGALDLNLDYLPGGMYFIHWNDGARVQVGKWMKF